MKPEDVERVELKYCERCGGLWMRREGSGEVFCQACKQAFHKFGMPKKQARSLPRLPVFRRLEGSGTSIASQVACLQGRAV